MTHSTTPAPSVELDPACTPAHIETRSFEIIDAEIPEPRPFAGSLWNVARRCIHTLGDTDIVHDLRGHIWDQWADETGYFPGVASAMETALASTDPLVAPFAQQMVEGGASVPVTPNFGAVQAKKTTNSMMQSILSGQKDVATATKDAAAEMTELLNK